MAWEYGESFGPGNPPNDGSGIPVPLGADGWPVVESPEVALVIGPLVFAPASPVPPGTAVDITTTTNRPPTDPMRVWVRTEGSPSFIDSGVDMTTTDQRQFTQRIGAAALLPGTTNQFQVRSGAVSSPIGILDVSTLARPAEEATSAAEPQADGSGSAVDEGYDPAEHTVTEVKAYLDENPDQTDYVLDRERAGKNRTTLTGGA